MSKDLKITLRFYPGADDELIAWLNGLHLSYGKKGAAIKDVLRKGLSPTITNQPVRLDAGNLLADIRQVVEVAIQASLVSFSGNSPAIKPDPEQTEGAEERLAQLDIGLSIDADHW